MVIVTVAYVDGSQQQGAPEEWTSWPGHGVDWIEVESGSGTNRITGHSVYWLYPESDAWVLGGASVGDSFVPPEALIRDSGQDSRQIEYMPDLNHERVKLGWWWR